MIYPLISTKKQLNSSYRRGNRKIKKKLGVRKFKKLNRIATSGKSSFKRNSKNGRLTKTRRKLHNRIIKRQFKNKNSIDKKDPDLYVFGGLPASGKGTVLGKKVPEKTVVIDSDEYKSRLAHNTRTPIKGYRLAHAQVLHQEAGMMVERAIDKSIKEKRNVTYDGTMRNPKKAKRIIKKFKKAGYDVHYMGTQKKPSKAITHASNRFLVSGRYVPIGFIKNEGNSISRNSWKARSLADTHQVYDTNRRPAKLISKSKKGMKHNFRDPKK